MEGLCVAECRSHRDCPSGEACQDGVCAMPETNAQLCATSSECVAGEVCTNGVCGPLRFVAPDAGIAPSSLDAGSVDSGTPDAGPALKPYGAVCARGPECESGLCLGLGETEQGRCSSRCQVDDDCFYPDTCLDIPNSGRLCGQAVSGRPTGAACPNGPSDCASGLCVDSQNGRGPLCTERCASLPSCPAQMTCQPVPDGRGGAVAVCIAGEGQGFGSACAASSACATGLCVGAGSSGVCTSLCARVPCPSGWSCTSAQDPSGAQLRVCAPNGAAGGGGLGAACTGASSCSSGLCLHDARTGIAFCTASCRSAADCASVPGLACVTLLSGARVCGPL